MLPEPLLRPVRRVAWRIRAQRAIEAGATMALAGLGLVALALLLAKTGLVADHHARIAIAIGIALPVLAALAGALRRVSSLVAARLLDRTHDTSGRIAAALELASDRAPEDAAWIDAAIGDAVARASTLQPSRALPMRAPRDLGPAIALSVAVGFLGLLEIPRRVEVPPTRGITPLALHEDDLDAFEERLLQLRDVPDLSPEVREEIEALNRVLEEVADRRIDREETLRELASIEARIDARRPADAALVRDELRAMGTELRRAEVARELAEAMRDSDVARAEAEMRELSERMRTDPPSPRELQRLRQALEEAAREREDGGEEELARREEEMERLLQRRQEQDGAAEEQEERLLQRRRRELDQLRRQHQERAEARRQLDRLRRELEEAARGLEQEQQPPEQTSEALERAAEDLNRMAREQMSQEQMEDLARQLREIRELIRRQRQQQAGGEGQGQGQQQQAGGGGQQGGGSTPMDRFVLRARGQGQGEGEGMPIGAPGGGREGQGQTPGEGRSQGGSGGEGSGAEGAGQPGGEDAEPGQEMLTLGEGGNARLEIPGLGGQGSGEERGAGGSGDPREGGGAGDAHAPASLDDPTALGGNTRTMQVRGDAQRGPTRSEVIRSAAQGGFATRDYRGVYAEYADHAEEVIERDRVPPGYRFYVRRYFQLIRPRDGSEPGDE